MTTISTVAAGIAAQLSRSAAARDSEVLPLAEFDRWFAARRATDRYRVRRIPLDALRGWHTDPATGNLAHDTGRFFTVEGLELTTAAHPDGGWSQPVMIQPEVGVLGLLAREFGGVLHFLLQSKMEPGNAGTVQLSPTVQATRSNFTGVHHGRQVPHLDHFTRAGGGRRLVDVLQSEHGAWFLQKRNRNVVVEVTAPIAAGPDFCWLTLGQLRRLLLRDNVVNMDTRTVLACLPPAVPPPSGDEFRQALRRSAIPNAPAYHPMSFLLHWLTGVRAACDLRRRPVALTEVRGWVREADAIRHEQNRFFEVRALDVLAADREVTRWTQPIFAPRRPALAAFLARRFDGVMHLLVRARPEAGSASIAELAPTVQAAPANYAGWPASHRPPFLDLVLAAAPDAIRLDVVQSEEGGRLHRAEVRNLVVEVSDGFPEEAPPGFCWMTLHQLSALVQHGNYLNVEARGLLACVYALC